MASSRRFTAFDRDDEAAIGRAQAGDEAVMNVPLNDKNRLFLRRGNLLVIILLALCRALAQECAHG